MSNLERVALGIRHPHRESIEYAFLQAEGAENLLPVLHQQYHNLPQRIFNEVAAERRLFQADDGVDFHQAARRANASRWFIHQVDRWDGGQVKPLHHQSLLTRWYHALGSFGGGRFHPGRNSLGGSYVGIRRHCIMGMLVELFLDDYPGAVATIVDPPRSRLNGQHETKGYFKYQTFNPSDQVGLLPAIVQREAGLTDNRGSFEMNDQVAKILEEGYRVPIWQLRESLSDWNLVILNDVAMHWPVAASLVALPAPGLFAGIRTR